MSQSSSIPSSPYFPWESSPPCAQPQQPLPDLEDFFTGTIGNQPPIIEDEDTPMDKGTAGDDQDAIIDEEGKFSFNAKYYFLTYPKCDIEPSRFAIKFKSRRVEDYHLVREKHDDGSPHYHAIVAFNNRKSIKHPRYFDVDGHHPKIEKIRSLVASLRYLEKEKHGEVGIHVGGNLAPKIRDGKVGALDSEAKTARWADAIETSTSADEFLNKIDQFDPRDLAKSFNNVQNYAKWKFENEKSKYEYKHRDMGEGHWELTWEINDWVKNYLSEDKVPGSCNGARAPAPRAGGPPL